MPLLPVRYDRISQRLLIGKPGSIVEVNNDGAGAWFAHLDDLRAAGATEMRRALARAATDSVCQEETLLVSAMPYYSLFDHETSLAETISFSGGADGLWIDIGCFVEGTQGPPVTVANIRTRVTPLLERHGWTLTRAELDCDYAEPPCLWHLRVEPTTRGRTIGELYAVAEQILALVEATTATGLHRETVLELLRAGRAELLVGQHEGDWLDVKSQDYELSTPRGKISLAQDVARFANAEHGGILVIGIHAKRTGGGEILTKVRPLPPDKRGVQRHRQALNQRIFPPPEGLTLEEVTIGSGRLIILQLPPQPEELKPFLVHGAIVHGRVEGAFISIVRRRGEASIPITAAAIHSTLAAGRALLRRGQLPDG